MKRKKTKVVAPQVGSSMCAEHFEQGEWIKWPQPPTTQSGPTLDVAPSSVGLVSMKIGGGVLCRFVIGDRAMSQPTAVVAGQPCEKSEKGIL